MCKNKNLRNMRLVIAESAATAAFFAVPIMTPFYHSINLCQEEIALTQMIFTAVVIVLNVPLGWVADKFGRKKTNIAGDLLGGFSLLFYAMAGSFWSIAACETLLGIAHAMSQNVDSTLLRHFCCKERKDDEKYARDKHATMVFWREIATLVYYLLGGPIGAFSFRLAIALSSVTQFAGAIISLFIEDDSELLASTKEGDLVECDAGNRGLLARLKAFKEAIDEIVDLAKCNLSKDELRVRIAAFAVARQITHGVIWCFSPLMLYVGVPLEIVSVGWAINAICGSFGTLLAKRFARRMSEVQIFLTPIVLVSAASTIMIINLNVITVFFYALFGIAQGWSGATMAPIVEKHADSAERTSVGSLAGMISDLLYIGAVWIINRAAGVQLQYALVATVAIFAPLAIPIALELHKRRE